MPATITIHIKQGIPSEATRGNIWIDSDLLASGRFAWGVVQHEYAHQVDFALLTDATRAQLHALLGGSAWCGAEGHATLDCERFAKAGNGFLAPHEVGQRVAQGTSLIAILPTAAIGALTYYRGGDVDLRAGAWMALAGIPVAGALEWGGK